MKYVKTVISTVIAISVIPMIALSVFNLTQEKVREEVVTFEILTWDALEGYGTVTEGTSEKIYEYGIFTPTVSGEFISNFISLVYNDTKFINTNSTDFTNYPNIHTMSFSDLDIIWEDDGEYKSVPLFNDNHIEDPGDDYIITVGDEFILTFEVPQAPVLSGVIATLLGLVSLVFASAILFSFYNLRKEVF